MTEEMKNGMLACPHCGARPIITIRDANSRWYKVSCQNNCLQESECRKDAIIKWNKRNEKTN
jgi:hypothetical protein